MSKIDLSIVVTAHHEGILLHKTLQSVFDAAKELEKNRVGYEVIVHVDNGDEDTLKCLKEFAKKEKLVIVKNSFGDVSQSRNYAATVATGKYVSFLDGDDLVSRNWYITALNIMKKSKKDCVVYPEAVLTFQDDDKHILSMQKDYNNTKEDYLTALSANQWSSMVMAKKKTFLEVPYLVMKNGYCHEDYAFNVQTLEHGILHLVAPGTVFFYRRREGSRLTCANIDSLALPRMEYFDFDKAKKEMAGELFFKGKQRDVVPEEEPEEEKSFRDNTIYKKVRGNWFLNYLITPFLRLALMTKNKIKKEDEEETNEEEEEEEVKTVVPDFVVEEWRNINKIEMQLYPNREDLENTELYCAEDSIDIGRAYADLSHSFTHSPDYVFIVPWVIRGGADKVLINYVNALLEIHPDWHIAVITTLAVENVWAYQLPEQVDLYELGEVSQYLSKDGEDVLMTLLITQLGCRKLHIINSELGYLWTKKHSTLVRNQYEINVSFFAGDRIVAWDGGLRAVSYENPCLLNIISNVGTVFTDNENIVKELIERNGFESSKFKVHYQPIDLCIKDRAVSQKKTKKILWAGRIDIVKMPELVLEIGEKLDDDIQIDMYGVIDNICYDEQMFDGAKNVNYCGKYNGFSDIPTENYDLFLYTSKNDGMPNTILEATAAGLPIIASNDGGVGEFIINNKTGILIEDFKKPDEYVREICNVYNDKYDLDKLVKNSQELLKKRHSKDEFIKLVKKDIG